MSLMAAAVGSAQCPRGWGMGDSESRMSLLTGSFHLRGDEFSATQTRVLPFCRLASGDQFCPWSSATQVTQPQFTLNAVEEGEGWLPALVLSIASSLWGWTCTLGVEP